jgi:hypothetical protein
VNTTAATKLWSAVTNRFDELCLAHGGVRVEDRGFRSFNVPTTHGEMRVSLFEADANNLTDRRRQPCIASIFLRFTDCTGGKVYDELHGYDFNGWSGKWNVCLSGGAWNQAWDAALLQLERKLSLVAVIKPVAA